MHKVKFTIITLIMNALKHFIYFSNSRLYDTMLRVQYSKIQVRMNISNFQNDEYELYKFLENSYRFEFHCN